MGKDLVRIKQTVYTCDGGSCRKAGAEQTSRDTRMFLRNSGHWNDTHTIKTRCNGRCEDGPTWIVQPGNYWYKNVDSKRGIEVLKSHVENGQPLIQALLFQDGALRVDSDNEKSNSFIKPFEYKELSSGEMGWITKGLSSDQYLYALFSKWSELQGESTFTNKEGISYSLSELSSVNYTDEFNLELNFGSITELLMIGVVGIKDETYRKELKVRGTFYFLEKASTEKGILFKNKMGDTIASISFKDEVFWKYCEEIQLGGIQIEQSI